MCNNVEKKYLQQNITVSHAQRLNSPFYPMISILKKYGHHQATMHDLARVLDKTLNKVTDLLEEMEENSGEPELKLVMIDILETLGGIILELIRSVYMDEKVENVGEFIAIISSYDLRFLDISKEILTEKSKEKIMDDNLVCSIFDILPEIDKFYGFFDELKDLTEKYETGLIDERKFLDRAGLIKKFIIEIEGELENKLVNAGEWGKEASPGDNLVLESLDDWEKAMDYFLDIFSTDFREQFSKGIDMAGEANHKLAMIKTVLKDKDNK